MVAFDVSFGWRGVSPRDVVDHGGEGVLVYSGGARPENWWCQSMRDAGLHVVWIFESAVDRALDGYDAGVADCRRHEARVPPGELSYVVACDLNNGALAGRDVTAYLRGWNDTTREPVFGQYGSSDAVEQGQTVGGKLQRFWGVAPWLPGGRPNNAPENLERWRAMGVHLIQLVGEDIAGTDTNEVAQANWWSLGEGEDDMTPDQSKKLDALFNGLVFNLGGRSTVDSVDWIAAYLGGVPGVFPDLVTRIDQKIDMPDPGSLDAADVAARIAGALGNDLAGKVADEIAARIAD